MPPKRKRQNSEAPSTTAPFSPSSSSLTGLLLLKLVIEHGLHTPSHWTVFNSVLRSCKELYAFCVAPKRLDELLFRASMKICIFNTPMKGLSKSVKHGHVKMYWDNDNNTQLRATYTFKDDKKEGVSVGFWENGSVEYIANYEKGLLHGDYEAYYQNGDPAHLAEYDKGETVWEKFFHRNGQLGVVTKYLGPSSSCSERRYETLSYHSNGQLLARRFRKGTATLFGTDQEWFADGKPRYVCHRNDDGEADGEERRYHPNGQLERVVSFIKGRKEGKQEDYYPNGQLESRSYWKDSLLDGAYESFHATGSIMERSFYEASKHVGTYEYFGSDGTWCMTCEYGRPGVLHGAMITYHPRTGKIATRDIYENGMQVGFTEFFDEDGEQQ